MVAGVLRHLTMPVMRLLLVLCCPLVLAVEIPDPWAIPSSRQAVQVLDAAAASLDAGDPAAPALGAAVVALSLLDAGNQTWDYGLPGPWRLRLRQVEDLRQKSVPPPTTWEEALPHLAVLTAERRTATVLAELDRLQAPANDPRVRFLRARCTGDWRPLVGQEEPLAKLALIEAYVRSRMADPLAKLEVPAYLDPLRQWGLIELSYFSHEASALVLKRARRDAAALLRRPDVAESRAITAAREALSTLNADVSGGREALVTRLQQQLEDAEADDGRATGVAWVLATDLTTAPAGLVTQAPYRCYGTGDLAQWVRERLALAAMARVRFVRYSWSVPDVAQGFTEGIAATAPDTLLWATADMMRTWNITADRAPVLRRIVLAEVERGRPAAAPLAWSISRLGWQKDPEWRTCWNRLMERWRSEIVPVGDLGMGTQDLAPLRSTAQSLRCMADLAPACNALDDADPWDPEAVVRRAKRLGNGNAVAVKTELLLREPWQTGLWVATAQAAAGAGHHEDALTKWTRVRDLEPGNDAAGLGLGDALAHLGRLDEACEAWSAYATASSTFDVIHARRRMAKVYEANGKRAEARAAYAAAAASWQANALLDAAEYALREGRFQEALDGFRREIDRYSGQDQLPLVEIRIGLLRPDPDRKALIDNFLAQRNALPGTDSVSRIAEALLVGVGDQEGRLLAELGANGTEQMLLGLLHLGRGRWVPAYEAFARAAAAQDMNPARRTTCITLQDALAVRTGRPAPDLAEMERLHHDGGKWLGPLLELRRGTLTTDQAIARLSLLGEGTDFEALGVLLRLDGTKDQAQIRALGQDLAQRYRSFQAAPIGVRVARALVEGGAPLPPPPPPEASKF